MPDFTVVICTHDRVQLLGKTIESLNAASRPQSVVVDILVAANACTDGTVEWLERYACGGDDDNRLPLHWIEEPRAGKSYALNSVLEHVDSALLAFVDDDHRVDRNYLTEIVDSTRRFPAATMFCGRILPDWDGSEPAWVHDQGPYRIYPPPVPWFELGPEPCAVTPGKSIPGGGNLFMYNGVLERTGGFRTDLGPKERGLGGSEDTDFVLRALHQGEVMRYEPSVVQYHYVDPARLTLRYVLAKSYQRSKSVTMVRSKPSGRMPMYLWRKAFVYLASAMLSLNWARTRFYMVRFMATVGEMRGLSKACGPGR
ncbi:glycosyltransferase family 2 protein [Gammaproteobacteria bacterium]|nr:glycosyltransferase family 2 protein [Gammaproteobacteria bacterium]